MIPTSADKKNPAEEAEPMKEPVEEVETENAVTENTQEPAAEAVAPENDEMVALNDKYLRLCAEYDNFRKRSRREKDDLYVDVKARTLGEFLPVYDNLERALAQPTEDEAYRRGVEMIMTQFKKTMEKLSVTQIPALGETFDPNVHNAIMHIDDAEKGENEIVEVFQQGFKCGDKVIRTAMVKVAN